MIGGVIQTNEKRTASTLRLSWRQPLHRHITALTIGLILLIVLPLGSYGYYRGSALILSGSQEVAAKNTRAAASAFSEGYQHVVNDVELLAETRLGLAKTNPQRLAHLPYLTTLLRQNQYLSSIEVAYGKDEVFVVKALRTQVSHASGSLSYIVDSIREVNGERKVQHYYFDAQLKAIGKPAVTAKHYHVLKRPWYQQAKQSVGSIVSSAYRYSFDGQVGITVAKNSMQGDAVVAINMNIVALANSLSAWRTTESSQLLIFDDQGKVLAYDDGKNRTPSNSKRLTIPKIEELHSPLLKSVASKLLLGEPQLQFDYEGEGWQGSVQQLYKSDHLNLNLAIISPQRELLHFVVMMRNESLLLLLFLLMITFPLSWLLAGKLSGSIRGLLHKTQRLDAFDFSPEPQKRSRVTEIDELGCMISKVKKTVNHFLNLTESLETEHNFDALLEKVVRATMQATEGRVGGLYLYQEESEMLELGLMLDDTCTPVSKSILTSDTLSQLSLADTNSSLVQCFQRGETVTTPLAASVSMSPLMGQLLQGELVAEGELVAMPLKNRFGDALGVLFVVVDEGHGGNALKVSFLQRLSGFASISIETEQMLRMRKDLLASFIQLIAGAVDAKSPYTGAHCQRVPELTKMIAAAACDHREGEFADFQLTEEEWEALHIGAWLHDCGKLITPDFVIDKATKLETVYDRLHEIRMRFEVLKRDAEIEELRGAIAKEAEISPALQARWQQLDEEFAFVAECNLGTESMDEASSERLQFIATRRWQRTLADNIGLSWEELQRAEGEPQNLPVWESLLADKQRHQIERRAVTEDCDINRQYGFNMVAPELQYHRGELYNLSVKGGTLTPEDRYVIQEHMVHTIMMLETLQFSGHLAEVPEIAGGHHENMFGTGYPRGLTKQQIPVGARMLAIADIFEALTAGDRPYKKAKTISQALGIMAGMSDRQHIDTEIFSLFVSERVYLRYAKRYLLEEQQDIEDFSYQYNPRPSR